MAGISILPAEVLLSNRVQEMVLNGEEPQSLYICRDHPPEDDNSDPPSLLPIIDLSLLSSSEPSTAQDELQKLRSALCSWGCFQAKGHGIPESFLDKIREVAREFFEQPMEEKKKYAKGLDEFEGYGADPVPAEGQSLDWSDRLFLNAYPENRRDPKFWPQSPTSFREVLEDYITKMKTLTELVSKSMAKSLNLEENCFLNQFGEQAPLDARFNYYSCCQRPDLVLGLKAHADGSGYTIILQDDVEGLQVLKDKNWITVPTISDALLILMGDQMEVQTIMVTSSHNSGTTNYNLKLFVTETEPSKISSDYQPDGSRPIFGFNSKGFTEERPVWFQPSFGPSVAIMTNGVFKSPVHRVLANSEKERISVAVFYTPESKKEIGPEEQLVNEERPRIFKKVKDYADVHFEYYQQGQRALHVARV